MTYVSGGALLTFGLTLLTCLVVFISWLAVGDSRAVGALRWLRFITRNLENMIVFFGGVALISRIFLKRKRKQSNLI